MNTYRTHHYVLTKVNGVAYLSTYRRGLGWFTSCTSIKVPGQYVTLLARLRSKIVDRRDEIRVDDPLSLKTPNRYVRILKDKRKKVVSSNKKPTKSDRYVGIEIEFICAANADAVEDAFVDARLHEYVQVKDDGSISVPKVECSNGCGDSCECYTCYAVGCEDEDCNGEHDYECTCECMCQDHGHEINILCLERERAEIVRRVCKVLKSLDARVNASCGLHVHLDMRNRNATKWYRRLSLAQYVLYSVCPSARRKNQYCQPCTTVSLSRAIESDRYRAINATALKEHKTLEVRVHSGTTDEVKILRWIDLLIKIGRTRQVSSKGFAFVEVTKLKDLKLNTKAKVYFLKRYQRFSDAA